MSQVENVLILNSLKEKRKMNDIDLYLLMRFPYAFGQASTLCLQYLMRITIRPVKIKTRFPFPSLVQFLIIFPSTHDAGYKYSYSAWKIRQRKSVVCLQPGRKKNKSSGPHEVIMKLLTL